MGLTFAVATLAARLASRQLANFFIAGQKARLRHLRQNDPAIYDAFKLDYQVKPDCDDWSASNIFVDNIRNAFVRPKDSIFCGFHFTLSRKKTPIRTMRSHQSL
jgi:hypothetical protein